MQTAQEGCHAERPAATPAPTLAAQPTMPATADVPTSTTDEPTATSTAAGPDAEERGAGAGEAGPTAPQATNFGGGMTMQTAQEGRPAERPTATPAPTLAAQPTLPDTTADTSNAQDEGHPAANAPPTVPAPRPLPPHTDPPTRPLCVDGAPKPAAGSTSREGMPCQPEVVTRLRVPDDTASDDADLALALVASMEMAQHEEHHRQDQHAALDARLQDTGFQRLPTCFARANGNCLFAAAVTCLAADKKARKVKSGKPTCPVVPTRAELEANRRDMCVCLEDIAPQLDAKSHELRTRVAAWYAKNENLLASWRSMDTSHVLTDGDDNTAALSNTEYIERIGRDGVYAGDNEITAMATMLKRNFLIHIVTTDTTRNCGPGTILHPADPEVMAIADEKTPLPIAYLPDKRGHYVPLIRTAHAALTVPHRHATGAATAPAKAGNTRTTRRTRSQVSEATQGSTSAPND